MPAPQITPQRAASSLLKSMPESVTACMPAATPYTMKSSHATGFFRSDVLVHFEPVHLPAEADRESRDVEPGDRPDTAAPMEDGVPRGGNGATYG